MHTHHPHRSPYLAAGIISPRACIRATMELSDGKKKVDVSRDTGIGRWVQEIGADLIWYSGLLV